MKTFKQLLTELKACDDSIEWAGDMPIEEAVKKCHRGDWLLWLAIRVGIDKRKLTLAKGHCANTVRHLMKDERSIAAVDAAIRYGNLEINDDELNAAAYAAYNAAADAAAYNAAYNAAAYNAAAYAAAYAAYNAAYAARVKNQMQTADICREIIGDLIIERVNKLLKEN